MKARPVSYRDTFLLTASTLFDLALDWSHYFQSSAHFWKGRVALYAILKTLGVGPGDSVVVPGDTCVVVPMAVHFAGAESIYADIHPATYNVALDEVERCAKVSEERGRPVRAVLVQHTYGIAADIGPICEWAAERGVAVVEDCCHAMGSRYRDVRAGEESPWRNLGTIGDAAFFSSQWSKPFTSPQPLQQE